MAIPGFIFGADTGVSYDQLQKRRAVLDAMLARESAMPQNVGEGIYALGSGIIEGLQNRKQRKAEEAMAPKTAGLWSDVAGLMGDGSASQIADPTASGPASASSASTSGEPMTADDPAVYDQFIGGVQEGGVTNPNALAAIAATGAAESGYSPANAYGSWSDPSQSGQQGQAGGIMSWRAERLDAMRKFAADNGDDPNRPSPATQAKFFVQEDPALIQRLNAAGSVEEAQSLMNGAWKFAGYDQPGGEAARRLATAQSYLPKFAGQEQPVQVASLDPAAGMGASAPLERQIEQARAEVDSAGQAANLAPFVTEQATGSGAPVSPVRQSLETARRQVEGQSMPAAAPMPAAPAPNISQGAVASTDPGDGRQKVLQAVTSRGIPISSRSAPRESVQRVAQAVAGRNGQGQGQDPRIARAMAIIGNPAASPEQRAIAGSVLQQTMKPREFGFESLSDGTILRTDPRTGSVSPVYQGRQKPIEVDGALLDPETYQPLYQAPRDPMTVNEGQTLIDRDGREVYQAKPKAPTLTDDQREYEFARTQGYSGNFVDFQRDMKRAGATSVTVGGQSSKFRDKADERMVTRFGDIADAGQSAASVTQTMPYMRELLTQAPSGPIAGRLAETFSGFSTAGDAFQATVNQIAPTLRIPGSGAQSDRDMDILMGSLPRLRNDPTANLMILDAFEKKARLNLQKSQIATAALRGEIDPAEADRQMSQIDQTSILPDSFRGAFGAPAQQSGSAPAATDTPPAGIDPEDWRFMSPEDRALFR